MRKHQIVDAWGPAAADRLRAAIRASGRRQDEMMESAGISRSTWQRIVRGDQVPTQDRLERMAAEVRSSVQEILYGAGDAPTGNLVAVPINDIRVSAGPGALALTEDRQLGTWPFPRDWVEGRGWRAVSLRLVRVSGDSQEPELRDGDSVLVDLSSKELAEGMHVIRLDDVLMIKRIQLEGARVRLKSANPSYDDIIVELASAADQFAVVGRAVWAGKLL